MATSSFEAFRGSYHYRPTGQRSMYDTDLDRMSRQDSAVSISPNSTAIYRYLEESDRPLFQTRLLEEDFTTNAWPTAVSNQYWPSEMGSSLMSYRYPSPSASVPSSSYNSLPSDSHGSPWTSPDIRTSGSPQPYQHAFPMDFGGSSTTHPSTCLVDRPCIALDQVQKYADAEPEYTSFGDEHYGAYYQQGYYPVQLAMDHPIDGGYDGDSISTVKEVQTPPENALETAHGRECGPVIRRRTARSRPAPYPSSKAAKRSCNSRSLTGLRATQVGEIEGHSTEASSRAFPCPLTRYGCTSSFGSKNEWKRHINTQHLRLGFWRCDQCPLLDRKPNDFNRKDLFIQHVRRMHPNSYSAPIVSKRTQSTKSSKTEEDPILAAASLRCFRSLRSPPTKSECLFCPESFAGAGSWDDRLEHVGRHMETAKKEGEDTMHPNDWRHDRATEDWLQAEGIITKHGKCLKLADIRRSSA